MKRILIVDDEADIVRLIADRLKDEGYQVTARSDGAAGLAEAKRSRPDVVLLDLGLPKLSGIDVCTAIRRDPKLNDTSILMLTGRGDAADRVAGLEVGADDYVAKPFNLRELVARVRALLRRWERVEAAEQAQETLRIGDLVVEPESQGVTIGDKLIHLTSLEFRFLHLLASRAGKIVSREEVLKKVWGKQRNVTPRSVDTYFWRLREKIETDASKPVRLKTIRGSGFLLTTVEKRPAKLFTLRAKTGAG